MWWVARGYQAASPSWSDAYGRRKATMWRGIKRSPFKLKILSLLNEFDFIFAMQKAQHAQPLSTVPMYLPDKIDSKGMYLPRIENAA